MEYHTGKFGEVHIIINNANVVALLAVDTADADSLFGSVCVIFDIESSNDAIAVTGSLFISLVALGSA